MEGERITVPKPYVLVVDDEPRMRDLIRLYLQAEFNVTDAEDGHACIRQMNQAEPDLVLLDIMMPGLDGWETLKRIRSGSSLPVIMLTARGEVPDRIHGLRMGADDYIAKPFDGHELVARIHAVLRRSSSITEGQTILTRGALVINALHRTVTYQGRPISLTPREFDLLTVLAAHPGHALSRESLVDRVWGPDFTGDVRTVDSHIKNLREELGDHGSLIVTVWGIGYRFNGAEAVVR
jgi:two-component system, OmpR family, response regulator ResD